MVTFNHMIAPVPPWVEIVHVSKIHGINRFLAEHANKFLIAQLNSELCRTRDDLFDQFAATLKFPPYFGRNWNAFEECVRDLEWLGAEGYVIQLQHAEQLLLDESEFAIFLDIMHKAGEYWATPQFGEWSRPAMPFHVLLIATSTAARNWGLASVNKQNES